MATLTKSGYGQVEPNHLSAQRTGQIYAQLPCATGITTLENGTFVKYDYANGEVNFTGVGEWMLVYNEVKVYEVGQTTADFRLAGTGIVPRVYKTNPGDIFTTNQVKDGSGYVAGAYVVPGTAGVLELATTFTDGDVVFQIVEVTTMPDGKAAVKLLRLPEVSTAASGSIG